MKRILCIVSVHKWEITKLVWYRTKRSRNPYKERFKRECDLCGKAQTLERPKKYHPSKYIWTDFKEN